MKKLSKIVDNLAGEWMLRFAFTGDTTHAWIESKEGRLWETKNFISVADWPVLLPMLEQAGWTYWYDAPTSHHKVYFLERANGA